MLDLLAKYNTVECWTLLVSIATLFVAFKTYRYNRQSDKRHKLEKIKRKQAQLQAMEESLRYGVEHSAAAHLRVEISGLKAEIEQLKSDL